ncbi:glycoside hydrolase family 88 protein [Granulicella sp. S156]|uniref:glycoside hydrolase family 88 protein n=1 Tax=Granulicella sp. S156 TaxID=1747224 RepID=UPI00131B3499|nr:glycoside hydrolase family 88 protein [Granulicella sp. S156]
MRFVSKRCVLAGVLLLTSAVCTQAQTSSTPAKDGATNPVVERVLREWPEGRIATVKHPGEWGYEQGVLLDGIAAEWRVTGDGRLFNYIKAAVDRSVDKDGIIHLDEGASFPSDAHSMDDIEMGRSAILLYRVLQQPKYYLAAKFLHDQMQQQPKNASGGYWHKQIYPDQMWLDGAYMAEPFLASYARTFDRPLEMDGVAEQLLLMDEHMRDRQTGLLRHGWDESKKMDWANKQTGLSPEVWARAMGWYAMALVDVLDRMPASDPQRAAIEGLTRRVLTTAARYQDPATGLWWQVMDKGGAKGNYLEASASCMFVYALAKGIRMDVLPLGYEANVKRGWAGIQSHFVKPDGTFTGTVKVAGLGGNPYRSGTYDYYIGEPVGDNDAKGVGAYLLALSEITQRERAGDLFSKARGKTVLVDAWFNSQQRKVADGHMELFHYKFFDDANSGYSFLGHMFSQYGMRLELLDHAPRAADLKGVSVYVIPSPDIPLLNPNPHYMDKESADAIEAWVKSGGVLMLMENDSDHSEFAHFNILSERFGIHYNAVDRNQEIGSDYSTTLVQIPAGTGGIFHESYKALEKEICTITVSGAAKPVLVDKGDVVMAVSHTGKGLVYANTDPWVYNEYTDGRKSPLGEQNFAAGQELVHWIVGQAVAR